MRRGLGLGDLVCNHVARLRGQRDCAESFFKTRLATVNSPMTWSRLSSWRSNSAICRSRELPPFWVPPANAASPPARKSSRHRYNVASATPQRRAIAAAGSSRRNKLNTACRRSFTGTSLRFPIEFSSSGYAVMTAWLPRPNLFCPEKPSHATIPKNLEQYSLSLVRASPERPLHSAVGRHACSAVLLG